MAYKGKYVLKKPEKYIGNIGNITYRSLWERSAFVWLEKNDDVIKWSSEELIIKYLSEVDNRIHSYYPDLFIEYSNGKKLIVEIKPHKQTLPPRNIDDLKKTSSKSTLSLKRKFIAESITYVKNTSKWKAANHFCEKHGMEFQIWDEYILKQLGIYTMSPLKAKRRNRRSSKKKTNI